MIYFSFVGVKVYSSESARALRDLFIPCLRSLIYTSIVL